MKIIEQVKSNLEHIDSEITKKDTEVKSLQRKAFFAGMRAITPESLIMSQIEKHREAKLLIESKSEELTLLEEKLIKRLEETKHSFQMYIKKIKGNYEVETLEEADSLLGATNITYITYSLFFAEGVLAFYMTYQYFTSGLSGFDLKNTIYSLVCAFLVLFVSVILQYMSYLVPKISKAIFLLGSLVSSVGFITSLIFLRTYSVDSETPELLFGHEPNTVLQGSILVLLIFGKCFIDTIDKDPVKRRQAEEIKKNASTYEEVQFLIHNLDVLTSKTKEALKAVDLEKNVIISKMNESYISGAQSIFAWIFSRKFEREKFLNPPKVNQSDWASL